MFNFIKNILTLSNKDVKGNKIVSEKTGRKYGYIPDVPDHRDFYKVIEKLALPDQVDLRPQFIQSPYDQGSLGSCTANAIAGAVAFDLYKQSKKNFMPSRLFIYFNERVMENTVNSDSGAQIRDGIKSINIQGVCSETLWQYNINKFATKPNIIAYVAAKLDRAVKYERVNQDIASIKTCLAQGFPMVFGFSVYESFESDDVARTGIVPMPLSTEQLLGGHAVLAVGYINATKQIIVRNSWGTTWGQYGYFLMPYDYKTNPNLASDFWTVEQVS